MTAPDACPSEACLHVLVAGTASAGERAALEAHLAACAACQQLIATPPRSPLDQGHAITAQPDVVDAPTEAGGPPPATPAALPRGSVVGRYFVVERLGAGGMGVVYAAFDPELDRKVALKLVRPEPSLERGQSEARQALLLREAQAMAKVAHPNVIAVHDHSFGDARCRVALKVAHPNVIAVHDVGVYEDQVFVAMELVDGVTLGQWCKARPRGLREILGAFQQAGCGLAACHDAGLVHRDFKPGNVLVGGDGRVRVLDFGLAHLDEVEPSADRPVGQSPTSSSLTETGAFIGTPAYMSPEQRARRRADARSDQYSFCVALHEALTGVRPRGPIRPSRALPVWLARVLARGLRDDVAERYPDMKALLRDLERDPGARRGTPAALVAAVVLVGVSAVGVRGLIVQRRLLCHGAEQKLRGVWDADRRRAVLARAENLGGFAGEALRGAADLLDRYAAGWEAMRVETCEATNVRGEQSAATLDVRMRCLDEKLDDLGAVADQLAAHDGVPVARAVPLATTLPSLHECADAARLRRVSRPRDPVAAAELARTLAEARALEGTGRFALARDKVAPLPARARVAGDEALAASALMTLGRMQSELDDDAAAERSMLAAMVAAERGGDERQLIGARTDYAILLAQDHPEDAGTWLDMAQAALDRGGSDALLESKILDVRTDLLERVGRLAEVRPLAERVLALRMHALGPRDPEVGWARMNLGATLADLGEDEAALKEERLVFDILTQGIGLAHPDVMMLESNIGRAFMQLKRYDEARAWLERSLAEEIAAFGLHARRVEHTERSIGELFCDTGDYAAAVAKEQEVLSSLAARGQADDADAGIPLLWIGRAEILRGRPRDAIAPLERAFRLPPRDIASKTEIKYPLGRALWESGAARARGLRLVAEAEAGFQDGTTASKRMLAEIAAWKTEHALAAPSPDLTAAPRPR